MNETAPAPHTRNEAAPALPEATPDTPPSNDTAPRLPPLKPPKSKKEALRQAFLAVDEPNGEPRRTLAVARAMFPQFEFTLTDVHRMRVTLRHAIEHLYGADQPLTHANLERLRQDGKWTFNPYDLKKYTAKKVATPPPPPEGAPPKKNTKAKSDVDIILQFVKDCGGPAKAKDRIQHDLEFIKAAGGEEAALRALTTLAAFFKAPKT